MDGEAIIGSIIMILCGFVCGFAFFGIGIWAKKSQKPMHFYSGTTVDPRTISDISAYNTENSVMWKIYSVPYFLSGFCGIGGLFDGRFSYGAFSLLLLAGTVGIGWLVWRYHRILEAYKI